ncbi:MAG: hypothetical protein ACRD2X_02120 [Vicinamibacteraceae bacterium]
MMPYARRALVAALLLLVPATAPTAQDASAVASKPRLVVVIGIDQFRTDYIDKLEQQ